MERVFLGLGSNVGDRMACLRGAVRFLREGGRVRVVKASKVYETSAVGLLQRPFLNAALEVRTELTPLRLLAYLKSAEKRLGRVPSSRWGPRSIDLDLVFYGSRKLRHPRLVLPHPRYARRKFVLKPLSDLAPGFKPPGQSLPVRRILSRLTDPAQRVKLYRKSLS